MFLILDNHKDICQYFACESEFLQVGEMSLNETLRKIQGRTDITKIYFPLELKFKNTFRQDLQGFELFKHIRLTPELGGLQFSPILLGYTYPLENLLRNPESTILCSPATRLFYLKNIKHIHKNRFFKLEETVSKESLKSYILFDDNDEENSEHDSRNNQGPLKLEMELASGSNSKIDLALWQKKVLFLHPDLKKDESSVCISNTEFQQSIKGKRILYLDDEAEKWSIIVKKLFYQATVEVKSDCKIIEEYFDDLQLQQNDLRSKYTQIDRKLLQIYLSKGKDNEFVLKNNDAINIKNQIAELLNYDLILLDIRLEPAKDKLRSVKQSSGVTILNKIQELNPFIPVIMFTASNKVESYKDAIGSGAYEFWIKNVSSANELKTKSSDLLKNKLQGRRLGNLKDVYAKLLAIKSRLSIFNYCLKAEMLDSDVLSNLHRERINNSVWDFIRLLQKYISDGITDFDIEHLWKMTGDSIQIRVPAISEKNKKKIQEFDPEGKIHLDELDFRWIRNFFAHIKVNPHYKKLDPYDSTMALKYITHSIDFLLDYR